METAQPVGAEFAITTALAFLAGALAMTHYRWERHDLVRHLSGIGAVVFAATAVSVLLIWGLGALGMTRIQAIGIPLGLLVAALSAGAPWIDRVAGYRGGSGATPVPSADPNPVLLTMNYERGQFNVINASRTPFEIWNGRINNGPKGEDSKMIVVPGPQGNFIPVTAQQKQALLVKATQSPGVRIPFELYLKNNVGEEIIAKFTLLPYLENGALKITVREESVERGRWSDAPAPHAVVNPPRAASFGVGSSQPKLYMRIVQDIASNLMLGMSMKAQRQRGSGGGSSSGFGMSSPEQSAPPPPPPPKPKADPIAAARLARLAQRMRKYDDSFERRSPTKPSPATVHDPEDDDYDDMGRLVGDLAQHAIEDAYNSYQARRGIFFFERFHKEISALGSVLAPTAGKDPKLQCLVGTYAAQMDRDAVLYVAGHIEKVANEIQGSA